MSTDIPTEYDKGQGDFLFFANANGFPPLCYTPLLSALAAKYRVLAPIPPPLLKENPPPRNYLWRDLGMEYANLLGSSKNEKPVAIGHSLGAISLLYAAVAHPERFRALVMIEPVTVPRWLSWSLQHAPRCVRNMAPPARNTLRKRRQWPTKEAFIESCNRSGFYKRFGKTEMNALANGALRQQKEGWTLRYSKAWETHFFTVPCSVLGEMNALSIPLLVIRGKPSFFLDDARWQSMQKAQPKGRYEQIAQGGHLLPMEYPEATAALIDDFIARELPSVV